MEMNKCPVCGQHIKKAIIGSNEKNLVMYCSEKCRKASLPIKVKINNN